MPKHTHVTFYGVRHYASVWALNVQPITITLKFQFIIVSGIENALKISLLHLQHSFIHSNRVCSTFYLLNVCELEDVCISTLTAPPLSLVSEAQGSTAEPQHIIYVHLEAGAELLKLHVYIFAL